MNPPLEISDAYVRLAAALERGKFFGEAERILSGAIKLFPNEALLPAAAGKTRLAEAIVVSGTVREQAFVRAEKYLQKAVRLTGNTRSPYLGSVLETLGVAYFRDKRYAEAADTLKIAEDLGFESLTLHVTLGDSLARRGQRGSEEEARLAIAYLDKALEIKTDCTEAYRYKGRILREIGRYAESLEAYDAALRHDPRNAQALAGRAATHWQNSRPDAALNDLNQAIALDENYAVAHARMGAVQIERNELAAARQHLDRALELQPIFPSARFHRGIVLLLAGEPAAALQDFDRALDENGEPRALLLVYRGEAYQQLDQTNEARKAFEDAIGCDPNCADAWLGRADCFFKQEDYTRARQDYAKAANLDLENPWPLTQQAECWLLQNQSQRGLRHLRKFVSQGAPDNLFVCWTYGRLLLAQDKPDAALGWLDRAVACGEPLAGVLGTRGEILQELGRYEKSLKDFQEALRKWVESDWLRYDMAVSLQMLGRADEAKEFLREAINKVAVRCEAQPELFGCRFNRALYHLAAGKEKEALKLYRKAIKANPHIHFRQEAHKDLTRYLALFPRGPEGGKALDLLRKSLLDGGISKRNPE